MAITDKLNDAWGMNETMDAVFTILEAAKTALEGHMDFLNWAQP